MRPSGASSRKMGNARRREAVVACQWRYQYCTTRSTVRGRVSPPSIDASHGPAASTRRRARTCRLAERTSTWSASDGPVAHGLGQEQVRAGASRLVEHRAHGAFRRQHAGPRLEHADHVGVRRQRRARALAPRLAVHVCTGSRVFGGRTERAVDERRCPGGRSSARRRPGTAASRRPPRARPRAHRRAAPAGRTADARSRPRG